MKLLVPLIQKVATSNWGLLLIISKKLFSEDYPRPTFNWHEMVNYRSYIGRGYLTLYSLRALLWRYVPLVICSLHPANDQQLTQRELHEKPPTTSGLYALRFNHMFVMCVSAMCFVRATIFGVKKCFEMYLLCFGRFLLFFGQFN